MPLFQITPELLSHITEATELRAWLERAVIDVAWLPQLQRETAARLAHSSTSIEGNPLTLPEVEALAKGEPILAENKAKQEVLNYLAAVNWIWKRKVNEVIKEDDLLHLHRLLTRNTLREEAVGCYKIKPNRVVNAQGQTIYVPPLPRKAGPLTRELLNWINSKKGRKAHPVIAGAIAHHRLVSIHPFADGNGRIARALEVWLLASRGFDTLHIFALDEYFEEDRKKYYEKIQQARELDNDLTDWIEYVSDGVVQTLRQTKERILSLKVISKSRRILLTKRQEDILRFLRDRGRVKSPAIEHGFKLTRARVNQLIKPMVQAGLILREGRTRATNYRLA